MSTFTTTQSTVRFTDTDDDVSFTATRGAVTFTAAYQSVTGGGAGATAIDDLTDVAITAAASGDILRHNGTAWVDTPGTTHFAAASTTPVICDLALATTATDGTATTFEIVIPYPGAAASGVVPAGWQSTYSVPDVATFEGLLASASITTATALVVSTPGVFTFAADAVDTAWTNITPADGVLIDAGGASGHTKAWIDGGTLNVLDANAVPYSGTGLLDVTTINTVDEAIDNIEGTLDTEHWCVAWYESNVTVASYLATPTVLGSQPAPTGGTVVLGGDVLLIGQSTTTQNGIYRINASTGAWTKIAYPDILIGNSFSVMVNADGSADDGTHFGWLDDDVTVTKRRSPAYLGSSDGYADGRGGRWIKYTPGGGGASNLDGLSDVVITAAASGDIIRHNGTNWVDTPGTDHYQAADSELAAIAALTSAADKGIQFTGSGTAATYDLTAAGKALLDDSTAAAQRTTLGVAPPGRLTVTGQYTASTTIASATSGLTNNRLYYVPILVPRDTTFTRLGVNQVATGSAGASSVGKFGIYNNTSDLPAASFDLPAGTIDLTTGTGLKYVSGSWALTAGIWWIAFVAQVTSGSPTFGTAAPAIVVSSSDTTHNGVKFEGSVSGSLPSTATPGAANTTSPPIIFLYV